ncbi:histone-lysine N-methyltransferase SETMAR [Trichonephila clavipes]|nr:histone-lysine N-methyltransferase SETMAR [Trichonephila clavipes]
MLYLGERWRPQCLEDRKQSPTLRSKKHNAGCSDTQTKGVLSCIQWLTIPSPRYRARLMKLCKCKWVTCILLGAFSTDTTFMVLHGKQVAPRSGRHVGKITEIIKVDRHVSSRSIAQELKMDHKTVLSHLSKVGFKKKFDVLVPHQLTPKNMMDRISICEALAEWNEIDPFLKRRVTEDEKWVTYDNIVQKRSWSKRGEAAQTVAKPGPTSRKVLLCIWWDSKGIIHYEMLP